MKLICFALLLSVAASLSHGSFEAPVAGGFVYTTPTGWTCTQCVLIQSGNAAWGSVPADAGSQFLGLQFAQARVEQTVTLNAGFDYRLSFAVRQRYGSATNLPLGVYVASKRVALVTAAVGRWRTVKVDIPGDGTSPVIKFKNDYGTTNVDQTIFIDDVTLITHTKATPTTAPNMGNGGFEQPVTGSFQYTSPYFWAGYSSILIKSSDPSWGTTPSQSGQQYVGLQHSGAQVTQYVYLAAGGDAYLTFWHRRRGSSTDHYPLQVTLDDVFVVEVDAASSGWRKEVLTLTGDGKTHLLRFQNKVASGDKTIFLDSVSITAA